MSPFTIILFSVFACIMSFWIRWRKNKMNLFQKYGIPGPKPHFITGNLEEFNEKREKCIDEWLEKYGNIVGFYLGGKPFIVCYDIELAKQIQIKEYKSFINREFIIPDAGLTHRLIFESLSYLKDKKWKTVRNQISPNFSSGKMKMISSLMSDSIKVFLKKIAIAKNKHNPIEIYRFYKSLITDIIFKTIMGIQVNVKNEETAKFIQSINIAQDVDTIDFSVISVWFPEIEPIPTYLRRFVTSIKYIMNYPCINAIVNNCRKIVDSRMKSGLHQPDLLQVLIDAEEDFNGVKRKLTTDCIVGNATLLLIVGFDTTASTVAWCTYYLAKYPEIQDKVRQEINKNVESNKEIEYADMSNLKYLEQVISETLRLHSLTPLTTNRQCSENFRYKNITIPKNVVILFPTRNLHKDPNYWKDPEKFDPERFSSENAGNIDTSVYQPFGAGPRSCIGKRFGKTIIKLTLANLIRKFKLELDENSKFEEEYTLFVIRPKNGVTVKLSAVVS